jgi:hypothetical protein
MNFYSHQRNLDSDGLKAKRRVLLDERAWKGQSFVDLEPLVNFVLSDFDESLMENKLSELVRS